MRAALEAAPKKPMSLDASRTGEPIYAQMGYQRRFQVELLGDGLAPA